MKIKLGTKENGKEGVLVDYDWQLTIIDRTKRPFKKKTI